jgi:glycosyltransferase involved in cell wall biosynthesis
MRIAAFGFRTIPLSNGSAGADKFAMELLPRLVKRGHSVMAYNRRYSDVFVDVHEFKGVRVRTFRTFNRKGLDTLWHSFKCTMDIILHNTADIVHIQNGGNSIWALPLRLFGKKVFISQDGVDWKRDKWPWYAKIYLRLSSVVSAYLPNEIIFDNVISKNLFEKIYRKKFEFIPFGSEIEKEDGESTILSTLQLDKQGYFLFVGRFIPDKGLHYLIKAFNRANCDKKLVLVGGSPNPSPYEQELRAMAGSNILFAGFIYGHDTTRLMENAYCYIQPSDVEGLSPVVLSIMSLGVPLIVSDIAENRYAVADTAITFTKGDIDSLCTKIIFAVGNPDRMMELAERAKTRALAEFSWETVTDQHVEIFTRAAAKRKDVPVQNKKMSSELVK